LTTSKKKPDVVTIKYKVLTYFPYMLDPVHTSQSLLIDWNHHYEKHFYIF